MAAGIAGVILAAGRSQRMGQDKAALSVQGQPLWRQAVAILAPQVTHLALNPRAGAPWVEAALLEAAQDGGPEGRPQSLALVHDQEPDRGPLGGLLAALAWAEGLAPRPAWLVSLPVDQPLIPRDVVGGLIAIATVTGRAAAHVVEHRPDGARQPHPLIAAWRVGAALREALTLGLAQGGAVHHAHRVLRSATLDLAGAAAPLPNFNSPDDLSR